MSIQVTEKNKRFLDIHKEMLESNQVSEENEEEFLLYLTTQWRVSVMEAARNLQQQNIEVRKLIEQFKYTYSNDY